MLVRVALDESLVEGTADQADRFLLEVGGLCVTQLRGLLGDECTRLVRSVSGGEELANRKNLGQEWLKWRASVGSDYPSS